MTTRTTRNVDEDPHHTRRRDTRIVYIASHPDTPASLSMSCFPLPFDDFLLVFSWLFFFVSCLFSCLITHSYNTAASTAQCFGISGLLLMNTSYYARSKTFMCPLSAAIFGSLHSFPSVSLLLLSLSRTDFPLF